VTEAIVRKGTLQLDINEANQIVRQQVPGTLIAFKVNKSHCLQED